MDENPVMWLLGGTGGLAFLLGILRWFMRRQDEADKETLIALREGERQRQRATDRLIEQMVKNSDAFQKVVDTLAAFYEEDTRTHRKVEDTQNKILEVQTQILQILIQREK